MRPGLKRFVLMPLLANIIFIGGAFYWLFSQLGEWIPALMAKVPSWLQWLDYLIWPIAVLSILFIFGYFFSTLANFIAAPFNGLLAEQLEAQLAGKTLPDSGILSIVKDLPRVMAREWRKLTYYLPRAFLLLLLYLIPGIGQTLAPIIWFLFSAWMVAVQYCDYSFDNHRVPFPVMHAGLKRDRMHNIQFGMAVYLFTLIPVLNLIIMPVAVCGATAMWVDRYRDQYQRKV